MSREDLLKSVEELEAKLTDLAGHQVALSKDIEKRLTPLRDSLLEEIAVLEASVEKMKEEIAARNNEAAAEINRQAEINQVDQANNTAEATRLFNVRTELEEKEKAVDLRIEQARINEEANATAKTENDAIAAELKPKQEDLDRKLEEVTARAAHQEEVIKNAENEIHNHRNKGLALDFQLTKAQEAEEKALKLAEELSQKAVDLEKAVASVEAKEKENTDRAAVLDAKQLELEKLQAAQEAHLAAEQKKIDLAWLQINKRIDEKQVDLKLEELKK